MKASFAKKYGCRGWHSGPKQIIRIDMRSSRKHVAQTLIHELLHAVYFVHDILDDLKEEEVVNPMSTGLAMLWSDNPKLMQWLHTELTS